MKLRINEGIELKFTKNKLNKGIRPKGMFQNRSEIMYNSRWYNCSINFKDGNILINNLMKVDKNTSAVSEKIPDIVFEVKIDTFKKNLILYLMNSHKINWKIFNIKKSFYERRKTLFVFSLAITISITYHFLNLISNNQVMNWMSTNVYAHTIIMFLTLSGFINIFFPFTIQKPITENDIKRTAAEIAEETIKQEEQNKRNAKIASC